MKNSLEIKALKYLMDGHASSIAQIKHEWFTESETSTVFNSCMEVAREGDIDFTAVKNHIHSQTIREPLKTNALNLVSECESMPAPFISSFVRDLENSYNTITLSKLANLLNDRNQTNESKLTAIKKFQNEIHTTRNNMHDMADLVDDYIEKTEQGELDDINARSLEVRNPILKGLFEKIRPASYCIGGRPGFHKTDFVINLMADFYRSGYKGAMFSFEDSVEFLRAKYIHISNDIERNKVYSQDKEELPKIQKIKKDMIFVYDKQMNLTNFRMEVDYLVKIKKIQYVLVDYLQLFLIPKGSKKHEAIGDIAKECAEIAKEHKIPVIVTSQVKERLESSQGDVSLDLGDLKESGDIEQSMSVVGLLDGNREASEKRFYKAKDRYGPVQSRYVAFDNPTGVLKYWGDNEPKGKY